MDVVIIKLDHDMIKVNLKGEIDHHASLILREEIDNYIEKHRVKKILFNFKDVSFMDSSGVGMIIGRYKKLQNVGGKIGVVNLAPKIERIFQMSGLFSLISNFNDEKEAIDKL
ncbi:MAG TPA: anti-sigma F factor antagonist [Thermoanaerobacterales bacterium]|uniref:anti-sigma F factor antagonist n=1 Tax=Tepidanaerobacter sp. GT38 TaxID=2722793 RepID=UPI0017CC6F13|nr:anti-sigma F factor antagonist [Tepidanaerobacter sp. GT38]MCG1012664.1 anti-sigma F factor antagonist [Tepidanaerobacter sp. GT38]HHY41401.1 anti-sigma F factor antagonist [Thermoanaerobacterales bacterium]